MIRLLDRVIRVVGFILRLLRVPAASVGRSGRTGQPVGRADGNVYPLW